MLRRNSRSTTRYRVTAGAKILCAWCLATTTTANAEDWPQWGGPNRNFQVETTGLADHWPEGGPKQLWSRQLGAGYSTIVASPNGKLFTMYRKGPHDFVVALRADTGETLWEQKFHAPTYPENKLDFGMGPNASPVLLPDRLIGAGFTAKLYCLALRNGATLWTHDLVKDFDGKVQEFGYSASPMMYKGNVIVLVGGKKHGVIAFNPEDGSVVWGSEPHDISYASPIVIDVDGQDQIVFMTSTEVVGLDASNGKTLWRHPCVNQYKNNATDPIWGDDNLLWVSTQMDGGTRVLKLAQQDGKTSVEEVWFNKKIKIFHWNAIRVGDYVYGSSGNNTSVLVAVNVKTGEVAWRKRGFHKALCVYADNKLIFLDEDGKLALAKVSPEGIEIASQVQLTEKVSWTVPTLVGRTLYLRDKKNIMALDLSKAGSAPRQSMGR